MDKSIGGPDDYVLGEDVTWLFKSKRNKAVLVWSVSGMPPVMTGSPNVQTTAGSAQTITVSG